MAKTQIINLPKFEDPRGNLSFFENMNQIPFKINRAYWIYDVPGGGIRGLYAFKKSEIFVVAMSGSFDVLIDDTKSLSKFNLNRSFYGLHVPSMNWLKLENFSTNSLALVVSSTLYDEDDYIRDYNIFKKIKNES